MVLLSSITVVLLVAFGCILKNSFRLVPTGIIALHQFIMAPGPNSDELDRTADTQQPLLDASDQEYDNYDDPAHTSVQVNESR
ncbi:hypothetical protein H4219_002274 [Mycoemilia scoparia]|uniref:Uncharacterized protein n=1 Tax=Mycoemilia scoparia TaxID=417184 RepID=A0A9W8DUY4_9FUNG|nr:hypothetical protein H4219_002274 [Mycoemilia scoparia]